MWVQSGDREADVSHLQTQAKNSHMTQTQLSMLYPSGTSSHHFLDFTAILGENVNVNRMVTVKAQHVSERHQLSV